MKGMYGFSQNGHGYQLGIDNVPRYLTSKIILNLEDASASFYFDPRTCEISSLVLPQGFGLADLTKELFWQTDQGSGWCGRYPGYSFNAAPNWNRNAPYLAQLGLMKIKEGENWEITIPPIAWTVAHLLIGNAQAAGLKLMGRSVDPVSEHLGVRISNYTAKFNGFLK